MSRQAQTPIRIVIDQLRHLGCIVGKCGSRVTCNPPPTSTDQDYLVEAFNGLAPVRDYLKACGFEWETGGESYAATADEPITFQSWRRGDDNLIVTDDHVFAMRHRAATSVCKRLNLLDKADRIAVFRAVLYGALASDADELDGGTA